MIMTVVYMAFAIFLMVQVWKLTDALMQGRGGLGISALDGAASKLRGLRKKQKAGGESHHPSEIPKPREAYYLFV